MTEPTVTYHYVKNTQIPIIDWGDAFKLTDLSGIGNAVELPGKSKMVSYQQLLEQKDLIIFCEKGGGAKVFTQWWLRQLDGRAYYMISGSQWSMEMVQSNVADDVPATDEMIPAKDKKSSGSKQPGRKGDDPKDAKNKSPKELLYSLKHATSPGQCLERFKKLVPADGDLHLIIHDLSALKKDVAENIVRALRMLRDGNLGPNIQVMLINSSVGLFLDALDHSGYLPLAKCFRLPLLDEDELGQVAQELLGNPFDLRQRRRFLELTGGQPFLAYMLLQRLKNLIGDSPIEEEDLPASFRKMRNSPPDTARIWEQSLKDLLDDKPELMPVVKAYCEGETKGPSRFPIAVNELPLLVSGWVNLNDKKRWGITSKFHAFLARKVLIERGDLA